MDSRYEGWSKSRRYEAAIRKVIDHGWTQTEAAKTYGIARQHLNKRVKDAREAREAKVEAAKVAMAKTKAEVDDETGEREVPPFYDWWKRYFGHWVCPDCGVHHEMPEFHREIIDACENGGRRVLINIPPYHSKSTLVTVWFTVYSICRNPNMRTVIISKSDVFAKTFLKQIKQMLTDHNLYEGGEGDLIEDYGPFEPEGQQPWGAYEIYIAGRTTGEKDPTVLAMGVGAQIYGRRADRIIFDDVATLENQRNPDRVAAMLEWMDKEALSRIGKSGQAIWIGTRVNAGDIYSTLSQRPGYKVVRESLIIDDEREEVLWPEHFPYEQALIHRSEMKPADFQLIYQNVDVPGLGAAFPQELVDKCKDTSRVMTHYDPKWRLIGGIDPAGANKGSGFTAITLLGIDLETGKRYLVDQYAERAMKAFDMKDMMIDWSSRYPVYEWRVEANGLQSQLIQYDLELIKHLATLGVRVVPHQTTSNKWDPQFGVESIAPFMDAEMYSIPWANALTAKRFQPLVEEFVAFPMGLYSDRVMSVWFCDLGARELLRRHHLPLFDSKMKVPGRVRKRRRIVDFSTGEVRRVPAHEQRAGGMTVGQFGYRRMTQGRPTPHPDVRETPPPAEEPPCNIDPNIWRRDVS